MATPPAHAALRLRILSYNIHKGIGGVDRRYRLERVIEVIAAHAPDIVFLQEVDDGVPRSRRERQVDVIGDSLGLPHRAYQANVRLRVGTYGNAILSRFPLLDVEHLELTVRPKKRRRALLARCDPGTVSGATLLLANCHLGLAAFERRIQVRRLLAHVLLEPATLDLTQIVGGDFNASRRALGARLMVPAGYRTIASNAATFPAALPMRTLDHLYFRGHLRALHSYVGHSRLARQASDHLPLIADFELDGRHDAAQPRSP